MTTPYQEIALSRALAREIQSLIDSYGEGIIPHSVLVAYKQLLALYKQQIEEGNIQ